MNRIYIVYDTRDGRIRSLRSSPANEVGLGIEPPYDWIVCTAMHNDATERVDLSLTPISEASIVPKSPVPLSLDKTQMAPGDTATVSGLPSDTRVIVNNRGGVVGDGQVEFSVNYPGTYTLTFTHPLHTSTEVSIEVST